MTSVQQYIETTNCGQSALRSALYRCTAEHVPRMAVLHQDVATCTCVSLRAKFKFHIRSQDKGSRQVALGEHRTPPGQLSLC